MRFREREKVRENKKERVSVRVINSGREERCERERERESQIGKERERGTV